MARARAAALASLLFAAAILLWFPGLVRGGEAISVADALFSWPPWRATAPASYRAPANKLLFDQVVQNYPWAARYRERLRRLELPLWNPHAALGVSFLANPNTGLFSPFHLPLLLTPDTASGLTLVALLKLMVAFAGARALARALGASPGSALLAGTGFAFSAPMQVWLGHPLTTASPLLPWSLYAAERLCVAAATAARRRAAVLLAAVTAFQYLSSHPETAVHTTLLTALWVLLGAGRSPVPGRFRRVALAALAMVLGLLVAAPQVLPFLDALSRSYAQTLRRDYPGDFRIPAAALPLAWAPRLYGTPMELDQRDDLLGIQNFAETALYAGVLPLVLIPAAGRRLLRDSAPRSLLLLGTLALAVAFDLGGSSSRLLAALPLIGMGAHQRLVTMWALALAVLAALALDALTRAEARVGRAALLASLLAGLAALAWGALRAHAAGALHRRALLYVAIALLSLLVSSVLALMAARLASGRALALALLILGTELWIFGRAINPTLARALVFPPTETTTALLAHAERGRFLALGAVLPPNTGAAYGLEDLRGYEPLYPAALQSLWQEAVAPTELFQPLAIADLHRPAVLPLFAVAHLVTPPGTPRLALSGLATERIHEGDASIDRVLEPLPRARAVFGWDPEADPARAGQRLRAGYPFRERVLLDHPPPSRPDAVAAPPSEAIVLHSPRPEQLAFETAFARPAVVVIAQGFDPGWRARVDGRPAPLLRAYGALSAVAVPAGEHQVRLEYWPPGLSAGIALAAAAALALAVLWRAPRSEP